MNTIAACRTGLAMLLLLLPLAGGYPPAARADTTNCTVIGAVPHTITSPGKYCLGSNLSFAGTTVNWAAIVVNGERVTIDCNGYSIADVTAGTSVTAGIRGSGNHIEVRNCHLADFTRGFQLSGSHLNIAGNVMVRSVNFGILAEGTHIVLRDNRILDTIGCYPIHLRNLSGSYGVVQGNIVRGAQCATATGIYLQNVDSRLQVTDNRIEGLGVAGGRSYGIFISADDVAPVPAFIERNHFYAMKSATNTAIAKTTPAMKSRCQGNLVVGTWTANTGCL